MKRKKILPLVTALLLLAAGFVCILLYTGVIHLNHPSGSKYPIRGVDVSHYQGEIDWDRLSEEGIKHERTEEWKRTGL